MPAKASWLLQVPEILEVLRGAPEADWLDRGSMEALFGVHRRRAQQLMSRLDGFRSGRTFLVRKETVIEALERTARGEEFLYEARRQRRLAENLDNSRREAVGRGVPIRVAGDVRERRVAELPADIDLQAGRLTITFRGAQDLMSKLFELSQAMLNDPAEIQRRLG